MARTRLIDFILTVLFSELRIGKSTSALPEKACAGFQRGSWVRFVAAAVALGGSQASAMPALNNGLATATQAAKPEQVRWVGGSWRCFWPFELPLPAVHAYGTQAKRTDFR